MVTTEQELKKTARAKVLQWGGAKKVFRIKENDDFIPFDLAQKLKDGSVIHASTETIRLSVSQRPSLFGRATEIAGNLADEYGFDYVRVQTMMSPLEGLESYVLNFYVKRESK